MSQNYDLIMAAYPAPEAADEDFDALLRAVKDKEVRSQGLILVSRDAEGRVTVRQAGDHLGRKGVGWGGGVGLLVGLFSPPLLGSIAVGAAAGGLIGKFTEHKVASGMEAGLGEKLKPGTAAIIVMVEGEDRLAAERALAGTPAHSVVAMDKKGVRGLKDALAEAAQKFVPDRTVLPIPDKAFGGTQGRTLDDSAWRLEHAGRRPRAGRRPQRPPHRHRRRRLRQRRHLRRADRHADDDTRARDGRGLQPLPRHGAVLADARLDAHRPQPAPRRFRDAVRVGRRRSPATPR